MNIEKKLSEIRQDPELKGREMIVVCLNKAELSMLEDAFLLSAEGKLRRICGTPYMNSALADDAEIRLTEDGEVMVAFHETRTNSFNHRPNGILMSAQEHPCVVFLNTGKESLTVGIEDDDHDSERVAPGGYTFFREVDSNDPELQKAWEAYMNSPKVLEGIREAQEQYAEKKRQRNGQ